MQLDNHGGRPRGTPARHPLLVAAPLVSVALPPTLQLMLLCPAVVTEATGGAVRAVALLVELAEGHLLLPTAAAGMVVVVALASMMLAAACPPSPPPPALVAPGVLCRRVRMDTAKTIRTAAVKMECVPGGTNIAVAWRGVGGWRDMTCRSPQERRDTRTVRLRKGTACILVRVCSCEGEGEGGESTTPHPTIVRCFKPR